MHRKMNAIVLALTTVAAVAALPSAAQARAEGPPISAAAERVALGGDPWHPSSTLTVNVVNQGSSRERGFFTLTLPSTAKIDAAGDCESLVEADGTWLCGGEELAPGANHTYELPISSATIEPAFGTSSLGYVAGRTQDGRNGRRNDFLISWPDKMPLRLAAKTSGARTQVAVTVTNAGTFRIGGYSLMINLPAGVRVTGPACHDAGRMDGQGCELFRDEPLAAGASDKFTVSFALGGDPEKVKFFLAPSNRYTNKDTEVTLTLGKAASASASSRTAPISGGVGGGAAAGGADMDAVAHVVADADAPAATGTATVSVAVAGGALLTICALLFGLSRRRRRFAA
jgi:hypothetical protein